jgi:uncharacterized protein YndB with AHSA1/START domain
MTADRIEREIIVEAAQERVWAVLTEAGHVTKWFGDSAQMDLRPGGQAAFGWTEYDGTHYAVIERVEPPGFFSYRLARPAGEPVTPGNSTLVEFTLTAAGPGSTRLRIVETGFTGLDISDEEQGTAVKENIEGWRAELGELKEYAEQLGS